MEKEEMQQIISDIINKYYGVYPLKTISLGGGSYARVFLSEINEEPFKIVVKIHLFPEKAKQEADQLNILAKHSLVKMPRVYYVHNKDDFVSKDVLLMEYIPNSINAADADEKLIENKRMNIANEIIDNLIVFHKTINNDGFGEIGSEHYAADWNEYYKRRVEIIMNKAEIMYANGRLNEAIFKVMDKAFKYYEKIFYLPVKTARLVHGDYNTWNILLDNKTHHVQAIIDPCNCCWADSEIDLYQLNNANGKYYGLFEVYKEKFSLSENYRIKISFYELFIEVMHHYDTNADATYKPFEEKLFMEKNDLEEQMKNWILM
jgi:fructosamine-3-kinase